MFSFNIFQRDVWLFTQWKGIWAGFRLFSHILLLSLRSTCAFHCLWTRLWDEQSERKLVIGAKVRVPFPTIGRATLTLTRYQLKASQPKSLQAPSQLLRKANICVPLEPVIAVVVIARCGKGCRVQLCLLSLLLRMLSLLDEVSSGNMSSAMMGFYNRIMFRNPRPVFCRGSPDLLQSIRNRLGAHNEKCNLFKNYSEYWVEQIIHAKLLRAFKPSICTVLFIKAV